MINCSGAKDIVSTICQGVKDLQKCDNGAAGRTKGRTDNIDQTCASEIDTGSQNNPDVISTAFVNSCLQKALAALPDVLKALVAALTNVPGLVDALKKLGGILPLPLPLPL